MNQSRLRFLRDDRCRTVFVWAGALGLLGFLVGGCTNAGGNKGIIPPPLVPDAAPPRQTPTPTDDTRAPAADATTDMPPDLASPPIAMDAAAVPPADVAGPGSSGDVAPAGNSTRDSFLALLRAIVRPIPPLAPMLMTAATTNGVIQQDFSFASTPTWRVPGTLRRQSTASGRLPVAIVLHETGADRNSADVVDIANAMVTRGFLVVTISGRDFGAGGGNPQYINAMKAAYANPGKDYPFLYDTAWDTMCLIDYLVTRDDVDPARIGLTGISKGGMETTLVAAADPRVAAAAPIIGVQSFKWGLENNAFQARALSLDDAVPNPNDAASVRTFYDRVAPGLVDKYDGPDVLPLVAPRPLIVIAGLQDPRNAMGGVKVVMDATTAAYTRAGAADHVKLFTADVGHDGGYPPFHQAAEQWLDQWLGNHPAPAGK